MSDDAWRGVAPEGEEELTAGVRELLRQRSRRLLGSLLRPRRAGIVWGTVFVVVNALAGMAGPYLIGIGIDDGIQPLLPGGAREGGSLAVLWVVVAVYLGVKVVDAGTLRAYLRVTGTVGEGILFDLRRRVFDHFQALSVSFYERYTSGRIISRLTSDVDALSELLQTGLVTLPTAVLQLVGITILLLTLDVPLALVVLTVFVPMGMLTVWFRGRAQSIYRRVRETVAMVIIHFAESLGGIRAVHAFRREGRNQEIFDELNGRYRDANMEGIRVSSVYGPGVSLLGDVAVFAVFLYGGWRLVNGQIELGALVAFLLYIRQFFQPMQELSQVYNVFQAAAAALEKLSGVLDEPPAVPEPDGDRAVTRERWEGRVVFEDVTFAYRDDPVLRGLSLEVPAGQTVALVGATGAGKSTIARLTSRFYDPTRGRVTLDGADLRDLPTTELRRNIVMITQEGFLFSGSVGDNIRLGRPEASQEDVERAARVVGAHAFIAAMPDGYDTDVRKRGGRLSAGQRQLVALARAFLADPQVIIFDEATSSIDMPSERLIQRALERVLADRTAFIIAHRLATVEIADRVLVVDGGEIVEDGSPRELLERGGGWAALADAWEESLA